MKSTEPWLPYDPNWLIELAKTQKPRKKWLHAALAQCTAAQARTCCAPKVCGYRFVDATHANQPGSPWQYQTSDWLDSGPDGEMVILKLLRGHRVGGIEFV